jgi:hypothetical protein
MKAIDFTHAGGFPLTQDELDYLQQAYTECINALAVMGGTGPTIITGMEVSVSGGITTANDGWFFYNGEMIRFTSGSYGTLAPGDVPLVNITPVATNLIYNDGSSYGAVLNKTSTLTTGPATISPTRFPFNRLQPFQVFFGQKGRESVWNTLTVSTPVASGGVTGTIFYKKDLMANTLQIRGHITSNNAQNFSSSPSALYYIIGTLPSEYVPNSNCYFTAFYFLSGLITDDLGTAWIKQINCSINTSGQILFNWIKPDPLIGGYAVDFNTVLPLD